MTKGQDILDFYSEIEVLDKAVRDGGRPVGFLLGAGCSASLINSSGESLIPAINGLTEAVRASLTDREADLAMLDEMVRTDGVSMPTIEDWLSRLRGMIPVMGTEGVRGLSAQSITDLERSVTAAIATILDVELPDDSGGFGSLTRWIGGSKRRTPIEIFTLNYDLLMETSLERSQVPYFDGFVGSVKPYLDLRSIEDEVLPPRWARLWKLHGSIDWVMEGGAVRRLADHRDANHAMIHPSHLKYDQSRKMPFLSMHDQFRRFMAGENSTLITVGYSFGDTHINSAIVDALQKNPGLVVFGLMYSDFDSYPDFDSSLLANPNFRLISRDIGVLGGVRSSWDTSAEERYPIPVGSIGGFASLAALLEDQVQS